MTTTMRPAFAWLYSFMLAVLLAMPADAADRMVKVSLVLFGDLDQMAEDSGRGGFARLATAVKAERARSSHVIIAHAGDALSPSLMSGFDKGDHIVKLLNRIRPDVFVPGNHEYDFGEATFRERMKQAEFPVIVGNLTDSQGKALKGLDATRTFTFDGVRVGIIGLTDEESASTSSPGTLKFTSSVETVKRLSAELRNEGADIVVALAHAGRKRDIRILRSGAVDVLLSGHDHDLAVVFDGKTVLAESKAQAEYLVVVELAVTVSERDGKRSVRWWPNFRIVDTADVQPDPDVLAEVTAYQKLLSEELDITIGRTETPMDSRRATVRTGESAIGNLFADALRDATGADVAIVNGGSIRGDKLYPANTELTRRDVLAELPFRNKTMLLEMTGEDLLAALENGIWYAGKPDGRFAQVSGVRIEARIGAVPGKRITKAEVGTAPLDPKALYKVATNDFIARGAEGYDAFKKTKVLIGQRYGTLVANAVMAYVRKQGIIAPKVEGRILLK